MAGGAFEPGVVTFIMEFVLTPEHPQYTDPRPLEQYCYRSGSLRFVGVTRCRWDGQGNSPAIDATGETDHGNVDSLQWDATDFSLSGDWGSMEISAADVVVSLDEAHGGST